MIAVMAKHRVPVGLVMLGLGLLLLALLFHVPDPNMEQMQQSTVRIICKTKGGVGLGSGFVVGTDFATYVVTNLHVLRCGEPNEKQDLSVLLSQGVFAPIEIEWADPERDLAIARSSRPLGRPAVRLADTASVVPGAPVIVIGFPAVADNVVDTKDFAVPSVSRGNISRVVRSSGVRYFQHTASTNPGNSGGPVYDEAGNVIGVNSRKALAVVATISGGQVSTDRVTQGEGIAAAVDSAELLPRLKEMKVPFITTSFTPLDIAIFLVAAAVAFLLASGGILIMTPAGRDWLLRPAAPSNSGVVVHVQTGRVRVLAGALAGMEVPISGRLILGRDPTRAQMVFPRDDTAVSRQHCEIRFDSSGALFEVRDLGSRNGTFVANGSDPPRRLAPDVVERLAPGQNILVGSSRNRLVLELG